MLVALNLLAFAMHNACDLVTGPWQTARHKLGARNRLFTHLWSITPYHVFRAWNALMRTIHHHRSSAPENTLTPPPPHRRPTRKPPPRYDESIMRTARGRAFLLTSAGTLAYMQRLERWRERCCGHPLRQVWSNAVSSIIALPLDHVRRLRAFKDFIRSQALANRRARVGDMMLGSLWFLLGPILEMGVYFFLVVVVFDRANFGQVPTFLGIMVGLAHYRTFQATVQHTITSITANRNILLQVKVEPMAFVTIGVTKQLQEARYYVPLILVTALVFGYLPGPGAMYYPLVLALILLMTWSVALLAACAYVYLRDLQLISQTVLRLMLYASPVIYPVLLVPEEWRTYYFLNPFATLFGLVQATLLGMPWPPVEHIAGTVGFVVALAFIAHAFYERTHRRYTKIL